MGQTILVVDDDASTRDLAEVVLTGRGYRVEKADGDLEAIRYLGTARPDMVLLDLLMPDSGGWKVLEFGSKLLDPPPVVVMSAHAEIDAPRRLPSCVGGYVPKPFDLAQLTLTCQAVLTRQRVVEAAGLRRDPRRTFLVRATVISEENKPLLTAQVHNISRCGLSLELPSASEGESVRLSIQIPGAEHPLLFPGRVAWKSGSRAGIELTKLSDDTQRFLNALLEPDV